MQVNIIPFDSKCVVSDKIKVCWQFIRVLLIVIQRRMWSNEVSVGELGLITLICASAASTSPRIYWGSERRENIESEFEIHNNIKNVSRHCMGQYNIHKLDDKILH